MWTPDQVRKKKTLVLVIGAILVLAFVVVLPAHSQIRAVVMGAGATPSRAVARTGQTTTPTTAPPTATPLLPTATTVPPTATSLSPTATPTTAPPTATSLSPTTTPTTAPPTPTPLPPTATPTTAPPTPTPTATSTATPSTVTDKRPLITAPADGDGIAMSGLVIEGAAQPHATVVVYDGDNVLGTAQADQEGRWRVELMQPLVEGEHVFTARVKKGEQVGDPSAAVRVTVLINQLPVTGGE